jgi:hypothetical protein
MHPLVSASHVILDAAIMGADFQEAVKWQPKHVCLYQGDSARNLASVAPYLFEFVFESDFGRWLLSSGWGQPWGVFIQTSASFEDLRLHLRKFLIIKTEQSKDIYFRYYDPRVLNSALVTFSLQQLRAFFGPVQKWIVEYQDGYSEVSLSHNQLTTTHLNLPLGKG